MDTQQSSHVEPARAASNSTGGGWRPGCITNIKITLVLFGSFEFGPMRTGMRPSLMRYTAAHGLSWSQVISAWDFRASLWWLGLSNRLERFWMRHIYRIASSDYDFTEVVWRGAEQQWEYWSAAKPTGSRSSAGTQEDCPEQKP